MDESPTTSKPWLRLWLCIILLWYCMIFTSTWPFRYSLRSFEWWLKYLYLQRFTNSVFICHWSLHVSLNAYSCVYIAAHDTMTRWWRVPHKTLWMILRTFSVHQTCVSKCRTASVATHLAWHRSLSRLDLYVTSFFVDSRLGSSFGIVRIMFTLLVTWWCTHRSINDYYELWDWCTKCVGWDYRSSTVNLWKCFWML